MTKELEIKFTRKGFIFERLEKSNTAYLYQVDTGDSIHYESFKIKEVEMLSDFEKKIGSGEFKHKYPSNENFGEWAWSTTNKNRALEIFNKL